MSLWRPINGAWRAVCLRDRAGLLLERGDPDAAGAACVADVAV